MAAAAAPTFRLTQCLRCSRRLRCLHDYRCLPHQSRPPDADDADGADGADDRAAQAPVRACALLPQVAFMATSACDGRDSGWAWSGVVGVRGKGGGACSALPRSLWHGVGPASLPLAPAMRPLPARCRVGALVSHFVGSSPPSFVSCPVRVSLFGFAFARRRSAGPRRSTTTVRRSVAPLTRHVYAMSGCEQLMFAGALAPHAADGGRTQRARARARVAGAAAPQRAAARKRPQSVARDAAATAEGCVRDAARPPRARCRRWAREWHALLSYLLESTHSRVRVLEGTACARNESVRAHRRWTQTRR